MTPIAIWQTEHSVYYDFRKLNQIYCVFLDITIWKGPADFNGSNLEL